jgi:putative FmdB family regulatory protein
MPIYEYRCQECGHELEKLQRMSEAALTDCPSCGKAALKRLISAAGFRLKGAGWYETDFKQGNKRNLADGGSQSDSSSTSNGAGSSAKESSSTGSSSDSGDKAPKKDSGAEKAAATKTPSDSGKAKPTPSTTGTS